MKWFKRHPFESVISIGSTTPLEPLVGQFPLDVAQQYWQDVFDNRVRIVESLLRLSDREVVLEGDVYQRTNRLAEWLLSHGRAERVKSDLPPEFRTPGEEYVERWDLKTQNAIFALAHYFAIGVEQLYGPPHLLTPYGKAKTSVDFQKLVIPVSKDIWIEPLRSADVQLGGKYFSGEEIKFEIYDPKFQVGSWNERCKHPAKLQSLGEFKLHVH